MVPKQLSAEEKYAKRKESWLKTQPVVEVRPFQAKPNGTLLAVTPVPPLPKMLVGWRAIAEYLGVPQTVATRWHREYGMPVIRIVNRKVFIHRDALVDWFFRLDRMQRKVIDQTLEKMAPGDKSNGRNIWLRYIKRKGRVRPDDIEASGFGTDSWSGRAPRGHDPGAASDEAAAPVRDSVV